MIIKQYPAKFNITTSVSQLICEIDETISKIAKKRLDSLRFGFKFSNKKKHIHTIKILVRYRDILIRLYNDDVCFCNNNANTIVSRIKRIINKAYV